MDPVDATQGNRVWGSEGVADLRWSGRSAPYMTNSGTTGCQHAGEESAQADLLRHLYLDDLPVLYDQQDGAEPELAEQADHLEDHFLLVLGQRLELPRRVW